jgi:DNA-binding CsgD family transcriptional regulator
MTGVGAALAYERVRRDVDVLSRGGLDTASFLREVYASLQRALPADAACVATLDPVTHLATGAFKFGDLAGRSDSDALWAQLEYSDVEGTSFMELCRTGVTSVGMTAAAADEHASRRFDELVTSVMGCSDELRVIALDRSELWGGIALFRQDRANPYSVDDVQFAASLSACLARGLRVGVVAAAASAPAATEPSVGPGVMIFDVAGRLTETTAGVTDRLNRSRASDGAAPSVVIGSLVAAAWRYASGGTDVLPTTRIRLASGQWIVLHAAPLSGSDGSTTSVVVTIEEARPPEIVPLLASAFGLTNRERDVALLILQGADTRAIAAALHLSAHTVQDKLKAIFDKTGVRSRRELLAHVFFDQYAPRFGQDVSLSGSLRR